MEVSGLFHASTAFHSKEKTQYPLDRGWLAPETVWTYWKREDSCRCWLSNPIPPARNQTFFHIVDLL